MTRDDTQLVVLKGACDFGGFFWHFEHHKLSANYLPREGRHLYSYYF